MEKPIFIVGIPRSGSTIWQNIIVRDKTVLRLAEVLFLSPWRKDFRYFLRTQVGDLSSGENINKMISLVLANQSISGITSSFWRFENIPAIKNPDTKKVLIDRVKESNRSLESIFKILIEEITRLSGYEQACVAFPVYPNHIAKLLEWYPECTILHVTRDPRGIAMSKTKDPGGTAHLLKKYPRLKFLIRKEMIIFVIIQYIWTSFVHRKYKNLKNYKLFKYEDLLVDPPNVIENLCDFIGVKFQEEMLDPAKNLSSRSSITGKQYKGFNKTSASNWKAMITPFESNLITLLTKGSMKRFNFNPSNHPIYKV